MATSAQLREQITAGRWDGPLAALYGTAPQELARQRARYCAALEQFELYFGPGREVQVYSAPGRAELGGNHTDHQHGYGLAAAGSTSWMRSTWPRRSRRKGRAPTRPA